MSEYTPTPVRSPLRSPAFVALVLAVALATAAALVLAPDSPLVVAPVLLGALLYAVTALPLRISVATLMFLMLSLEVKTDAVHLWHTPLAFFGDLLRDNLEDSLHLPGMKIGGAELTGLLLLALGAWRRGAAGPSAETAGHVPAPSISRMAMVAYALAVAWMFGHGALSGGGAALWLFRRLFQVPLWYTLYQMAFAGPRDHLLVGRVVVTAGCIKGVLAFVVQQIAVAYTGGEFAHATNHGDSILFSVGLVIVLVNLLEQPSRQRLWASALPIFLLLLGIKDNNRRIAIVELILALGMVFILSPWSRWKRWLTRTTLLATPFLLVYLAVGWNSTAAVFAPIHTLRSVTESTPDRSSAWRNVENWNLSTSMRRSPILGIGLGNEYTLYMKTDDISNWYPEWRRWPHNEVLGVLLLGGLVSFSAIWSVFAIGIFLAVRAVRAARTPAERIGGFATIGVFVACGVQAWGDLGSSFTQYRVLLALAFVLVGKLAVTTGAWPARPAPPEGSSMNERWTRRAA